MKLQDRLVYKIRVGGKTYRLKTDFRNVLEMFEILKDKKLTEPARIYLALSAIVKRPPKDIREQFAVFLAAKEALIPPHKQGGTQERITDFEQDADMIRAAFRQAYGIDLYRARLHWTEFSELLNNLPDGTRYASVIDIRSRPLPEATKWNAKERQALLEAKMKFGLEKSEEEVKASYRRGLNSLANSLMMLAETEGSDDNA